jgi:hypothetical protein
MPLGALSRAIDELIEVGPGRFGDAESVVALQTQLNRLEAVVTAATAAFDSSAAWAVDGAQNCTQWLATMTHLPKKAARRRLRIGARLRRLPVVQGAWRAGEITEAQVAAITALDTPSMAEALGHDEEDLVDHARRLRFEAFARALAYWRQFVDLDGAEREAEEKRASREMHLSQSFDGMWVGKLTLDPISGEIVSSALRRIEDELFLCDWREARERLDRDPKADDLLRTPGQRRVDALVEMAVRSASVPEGAQRPLPLINVMVDAPTTFDRVCELASGTVVTPGDVAALALRAEFERAAFSTPNRVDISERSRLFTGATRRKVVVRDRRCQHEFCDRRAVVCQVDHLLPWSEGGLTTEENGRLLCGFHNRLRNQRPPPSAA